MVTDGQLLVGLRDALIAATSQGKKFTKLEWLNYDHYGFMIDSKLFIHKPDGKVEPWQISDADRACKNWIVFD